MKIKDEPKHGEEGHFCHGGCEGYAKGGRVDSFMEPAALAADEGKGDLAQILAGLGGVSNKLTGNMIETRDNEGRTPDSFMDAAALAADEGKGTPAQIGAGMEGVAKHLIPSFAEGGQVEAAEKADEKDPSEIPEDIREYIEQMHKEKRESRPDEGWRIKSAEKPEAIAPYKKDEEEAEKTPDVMEQLRGLTMPGYARGGEIPGYDEGAQVPDPNALLGDIAPAGTGTLAPSPAAPMPLAAPIAPPPMPAPAMAAAKPPMPSAPGLTNEDFMAKANKMLGLDPQGQAGLMKLLGDRSQRGQIGAGIAGIGDAIASGGTLGKVNPGNLDRSEGIIQNKEKEGIEGMQTIRGNQEKAFDMAQKLQAQDPNSPLSKYAQKAYAGIGKKLGLDLSKASASLIGDVSGKGVEALNTEYQNQLKMMGLDLQKKQVEATIGNQKAERDIAREGHQAQAAEKLSDRGVWRRATDAITGNPATKVLERQALGASAPVSVGSRAEYDALPAGTHYVDSFGTEKVKK